MKRLLSLILIGMMVLTACQTTETAESDTYTEEAADTQETATETQTAEAEEEAEEVVVEEEKEKKKGPEMPTLPDMDFEGLTFKDDGYEIVEYKSLSDGDTATLIVGNMPVDVRFLAVDTPETSGSSGLQPWALPAKEYTKNALENAEVIIIEKDLESDIIDKYGRLLGWIWVDGELLQYKLVEEGLAWVKYLYGDYKYNPQMITLEAQVQKTKIKIWGEDDPDYDYENKVKEVTIKEARELQVGSNVKIRGVVTNYIGQNAFITDGTASIYIYANRYNYGALKKIGAEIELTGKIIEYNGLAEISSIEDKKITLISENNEVVPTDIVIDDIGEEIEGDLVRLTDLTIDAVKIDDGGGYDIVVTKDGSKATIRIDKYLDDYPDPDTLEVGMVLDVVGSIGQYLENYQIMIKDSTSIIFK